MATTDQIRYMNRAPRPREERESIGQFLTPAPTAKLLAESFSDSFEDKAIRLLDPGAGAGALTLAFVERVLRGNPASLNVTAVESDSLIVDHLRETLERVRMMAEAAGVPFQSKVYTDDFVRLASEHLELFSTTEFQSDFTHVIMNPPYNKISSDGEERKRLSRVGIETSNIYAGFVSLSVKLLRNGGELVAITPRSFCNGPYFRPFRELLTTGVVLRKFHVVTSRTKAFSEDAVLQENVIFAVQKTELKPDTVEICTSEQATFEGEVCHRVPYTIVVHPRDAERVFYLPVDAESVETMSAISELPCTLEDLGLTVSTGPVVDFRAKNLLRKDLVPGAVPLIYPSHFTRTGIEWPKEGKKSNAILISPELMPYLVPTGTYVVTKRFSSKEERKRIVARVLKGMQFKHELLGLENHLNFFHQNKAELDLSFAFGLAAFLNWTVLDSFFRQFNGHTQVNASDLRLLRYPNVATLRRIGAQLEAETDPWQQERIDALVSACCNQFVAKD